MSDVFISYSRRDKAFVRQLFDLLEQQGHDTWVDWDDIEYAEDWWRKICAGIEEADNFVFIMTPDSVRSKICFDEIDFAVNVNKRVIPVLRREITEDADQQRMHPALQRHNWLPLSADEIDEASIRVLLDTIAREPEHVRAHTRFLVRAREWDRAGHNPSLLLRGDDLKQAENWLTSGVNREPAPTQLHAEYVSASRLAERNRQRTLFAGVAVALVVSLGLALLSFALFQQSEERRQVSEQRGTAVAQQAATATIALGEAEINLRQAWETQSRLLADFSGRELAAGNVQTALLLALESLSHADEGVVNLENTSALRNVLAYPGEALYMAHDDIVWNAAWNGDASQILSYSQDNSARLWDAHSGEERWRFAHEGAVSAGGWNADYSQVITASIDGTARTWDVSSGENRLTMLHEGAVWGALWFEEDQRIMTVENTFDESGGGANSGRVHIWDAADGSKIASFAHDDLVRFAWVNQEAGQVLTSCDDGLARIWDIESGELLLSLEHDYAVWRATYNEDKSRVLTMTRELSPTDEIGEGSSVQVWDATTGEALLSLPYTGIPSALPQWNADGSRIMTASSDDATQTAMIQVWDAETGAEPLALRHVASSDDIGAPQPSAIWSADESRILSWAGSTLRVWDAETGDLLRTFQHQALIRGAAWSKDERRVLAWDNDGVIQVWDLGTQQALTTLRHDQAVQGATWSDDETAILSWSYDGTLRLWNVSNPAELLHIGYDTPFGAAAWNPAGNQVASWSGASAAVWDLDSGERLFAIAHDGETVHGMAWNADGSQILSWGRDGMARLWDASNGSAMTSLPHDDVVLGAAWSHSEDRILTYTLNGMLHVWDLASESELFPAVRYTPENSGGANWSPDDKQILSWSSDDYTLHLWDAASGEAIQSVQIEPGFIGAAWNPAGTRLLIWNNTGIAQIWDPAAGSESVDLVHVTRRADLANFEDDIRGGQWSADGSRVLTWTTYGDARIWDAESGAELAAIDDCGNYVQWSADENRLLCGSGPSFANPGLRIWDIAQGEVLLEYPLEIDGQLDGVAWNADETRLLAWKILDGETFVWNADIQELIDVAQRRTYRALTAEERARFFVPPETDS